MPLTCVLHTSLTFDSGERSSWTSTPSPRSFDDRCTDQVDSGAQVTPGATSRTRMPSESSNAGGNAATPNVRPQMLLDSKPVVRVGDSGPQAKMEYCDYC